MIKPTFRPVSFNQDNAVNQKLITKMFAKLGYAISLAHDGQRAVDMWSNDPSFDVIFMDMQMPVMDGLEATRRIRETRDVMPQPYIIALTANVTIQDKDRCLESGMNEYLSKPIKMQDLVSSLENLGVRKLAGQFMVARRGSSSSAKLPMELRSKDGSSGKLHNGSGGRSNVSRTLSRHKLMAMMLDQPIETIAEQSGGDVRSVDSG
ncbi:hypothetical protein HK097_008134 [Rhizophlyctis rosea]|uniref:Response regulatory domain-containing protein n=1 Tax=Rhizophlyctis rosea TaxID=64517 RepID=A0AAD5X5J2_9FUNG|nr:hypothetical protein HK097_008134 [Rhizophlyctis rosea]